MRIILAFLAMFSDMNSGFSQESVTTCFLYGPSYQLSSDTVVWVMTVGSGQSCVRGLRSSYTTLDSTKLITPPQNGQVKLEGPGFVYKAGAGFQGEDSFVIFVSGKLNKINGSSTIRIVVSVR
jgi:hypothetical protein